MKSFHIIVSVLVTLIVVFSSLFVSINQSGKSLEAATSWTQSDVTVKNGILDEKYIIDSYVIKDGSIYKMWYTHLVLDMSVSQLFTDIRGLNLGNIVTALQGYEFNTLLNKLSEIDSASLWTILNGTRTVIGYAEYNAGTQTWNVVDDNVLGTTGSLFASSVGFPSVIKDGTTYKMWYTSFESTLNSGTLSTIFTDVGGTDPDRIDGLNDLLDSTKTVIKYATSNDGYKPWTIAATPALEVTTGGDWDIVRSVGAPSVILDGTTYKMWYTRLQTDFDSAALVDILTKVRAGTAGISDLFDILDSSAFVIGYATSNDGAIFTPSPGNDKVLPNNSTPAFWQSAMDPCVIKNSATSYDMWYMNGTSNINQSLLQSIITAVRNLNLPTLWTSLQTKSFADFLIDFISLNVTNLKTLLTGTSTTIGHAVSSDGIAWTVSNPSDLAGFTTTPWSSVGAPSVVKSTFQTEIWFSQGIPALTWQNIVDRIQGVDSGLGYAKVSTLILGGGGGGAPTPITGIGKVCYPLTPLGYTTVNITLTSEDEMCTIFIPKATLTQTKDYEELKCISCSLMLTPPAPPAGKIVMVAYNIEPDGALFEPSITVSIKYATESIPKGVKESSLKLAYFDSTTGIWNNLNNVVVDTDKHLISGKTNHFTPFGILSDKGTEPAPPTPPPPITPPVLKPAIFITSALTVSPTVVKPGEMVTIDVTVVNTGEQAGTYTVKLIINSIITKTQDVTLKAGESKSITFTISENVAGTYHVGIDRLAGSFVVQEATAPPSTITPVPTPPALKPTNWGLIAAGIILGVVLIVLAGWLIITRSEKG
jgi:hypothetical protein